MFALKTMIAAVGLALAGTGAAYATPAVTAAPTAAATEAPAADAAATTTANAATPADPALAQDGAPLLLPVEHVGQPSDRWIDIQTQVTPNGREAKWFHNAILVPLISVICIVVLALLLWVMFRYRAAANPVPSKTSHNTFIEIIWTLVPVLILVAIAVPSIRLLAAQFKPAPKGAITLKATGNQWYWTYEYPDHGDIQLTSNMLKEQSEVPAGTRYRTDADGPRLLAVDQRVVLPVGVPIRLLTTAADVIHSWAIPAFWIKLDAVPGRINETSFTIEKPGVYFGQCSELCGARHGYMPIAVEAVPLPQFEAWVKAKGGKMPGAAAPAEAAPAPAPAPAPAAATAANDSAPVENVTVPAATTNQAATANPGN
ncbi:cytochrome c oxidase subunit II [Sphingomonas sp.]|uniref:cytochrome c oxidase subunit II n=1 Tax=Sphingomonas sp. TaxID=28214 RepID=UPI0039C99224